jgi:hypothetical protein
VPNIVQISVGTLGRLYGHLDYVGFCTIKVRKLTARVQVFVACKFRKTYRTWNYIYPNKWKPLSYLSQAKNYIFISY